MAKKRSNVEESYDKLDSKKNKKTDETYVVPHFKINCKFKNKKQREMYDTIMANRITIVKGCAGTGKTMIALMAGLECVKDPKINIDSIVLTKTYVEVSNNKIGTLPGELNEKIFFHYTHFYDNITKLVGNTMSKLLKERNIIKDTVLNFLRGSTFGKWDENGKPVGSFCIFDECQNSTITEMKTFISRISENTKIVILGDTDQIDIKLYKDEKCGLEDAWDRLQNIDGIGFIEFTEDDIVRDPFLIEIMKRYKKD